MQVGVCAPQAEGRSLIGFKKTKRYLVKTPWGGTCPTLSRTNSNLSGNPQAAESLCLDSKSKSDFLVRKEGAGSNSWLSPELFSGSTTVSCSNGSTLTPQSPFPSKQPSGTSPEFTQDRYPLPAPEHHRTLTFWGKPSPNGSHFKHGLSHFFPEKKWAMSLLLMECRMDSSAPPRAGTKVEWLISKHLWFGLFPAHHWGEMMNSLE